MRLAGKIALITGSSKGIGRSIAERFAQEGADVVINYNRTSGGAEEALRNVEATGRRGLIVKADLSSTTEVRKLIATAIAIDKDQTDQMCPGEAVISHEPLGPQRSAIDPYRFTATLNAERFDEVILYWTYTDAFNGDFDPSDESKKMTSIPMENQAGTWVAELAPQGSVINPDIGAITIFYQICAFDNEAAGLDSIACTPSPMNNPSADQCPQTMRSSRSARPGTAYHG